MTETLLERSTRYIDSGDYGGPRSVNPTDATFHEIADGLAMVCGFSHIWTLDTGGGLVVIDTSVPRFASAAVGHLRRWRSAPVETIIYTHGHVDHTSGAGTFLADADARSVPAPTVVGHAAVAERFDRYDLTSEYNETINRRQFGANYRRGAFAGHWVRPGVTYGDRLELEVGDAALQLTHARGETDDHTIVWSQQHRMLFTGDLIFWAFPNAGNPQKVQRYPADWAAELRRMIALEPDLLLPAHGLPVSGAERIATVLNDVASALEGLLADTLEMMNAGARLDDIVATVRVPQRLLDKPYLRPTYDDPEFVVRNIWRLYGGWYDGNPARLKPPADREVAAEVAALSGGAGALARRASELCESGGLRLACQLAEWAAQAAPSDPDVHAVRAEVYRARRDSELSLMARGLYRDAAATSESLTGQPDPPSQSPTSQPDSPSQSPTAQPDSPSQSRTSRPDSPSQSRTSRPDSPSQSLTGQPDSPSQSRAEPPDAAA